MGKQGPEKGHSYPRVIRQMFLKIRKLDSLTASHPSAIPLPVLLEPWSFPWYYLVPMPDMSTILGEATTPRPPVGGEREFCCSSGALVPKGSSCLVVMCPRSKGQAGRQAVHTFYGWATSQNSKQRGRQLAPEPSRE